LEIAKVHNHVPKQVIPRKHREGLTCRYAVFNLVFYFQLRCGANVGISQNKGALSQLDKRTTAEISYLSLGFIRSGEGLINLAHPLQDSIRKNRTQIVWPRPAVTAHHAENDSICIA